MGYDAVIHIRKNFSIKTIEKLLAMMEYRKAKDSFYCGNDEEYKYFTGVSIWLAEENEEERIYRIHSQIWASGYDLHKLNETIRCFKQYCNATFESDEGKNRYFEEGKLIKRAESGCYFAVERLYNNFVYLRMALGEKYPVDNEGMKQIQKDFGLITPSVFNANVYSTYLCSLIEEYFKSTYIALLKFSNRKDKILHVKFSPYDLIEISDGKKTVEEAYANTLSFQNISKINHNFHELDSSLNIGSVLKLPYHRRKRNLYEQINDIL